MSDSTKYIPSIKIAMLGGSGAGKTIYLASMFHSLKRLNTKHEFYIRTDENTSRFLRNIYEKLDSGNVEGTRKFQEYKFTFYVKDNKDDICSFKYIDYSGGDFIFNEENPNDEKYQKIKEFVNQSDFVLCLLDGEKIVQYMQEDPNSSEWEKLFEKDLVSMLDIMIDIQVPVHFVISKWDYVKQNKIEYQEIKKKLMEISELQVFINTKKDLTIRLIPVSSVGFGSFNPEIQDGSIRMVRNSKIEIQPFQLEVPLAYAFFDIVSDAKIRRTKELNEMHILEKLWEKFKEFLNIGNKIKNPNGLEAIGPEILNVLTDYPEHKFRQFLLKKVNENQAYSDLAKSLKSIKDKFEDINGTILK